MGSSIRVTFVLGAALLAFYLHSSSLLEDIGRLLSNHNYGATIGWFDAKYSSKGINETHQDVNGPTDQATTNAYYDMATDFYEYGWGQSFHFATQHAGESFRQAIVKHEYFLADRLGLRPGDKVLDVGMGVGGPMRNIARYSGAHVTGITINEYQVRRCGDLVRREGVSHLCECRQMDFTKQDRFANDTFDKAYAIESLCHLMPRLPVLKETFRTLKPGGLLFSYEWLMTDKFDPSNLEHLRIKRGIEHGDGLAEMITVSDFMREVREAGFEVVEEFNKVKFAEEVHGATDLPWYLPLKGGSGDLLGYFQNFPSTQLGRVLTHCLVTVLEAVRLAPAGIGEASTMLRDGADNLLAGGELGIFTPMYVVVARKPLR